ncbi:MAG: hypothetical protein J3K34DRAFT_492513 [Monoraphidium minutum]|nr:MAG: hypothetical protein J3K34DRAFT_492513 [Monoraphidium minutum]
MGTQVKSIETLDAQWRLWPLHEDVPGPARDAVLAALPLPARRCLRATCRAARAAIDARITAVRSSRATAAFAAALAAAAPRLPALRRVDFGFAFDAASVDRIAAAVAALSPSLASFSLCMLAIKKDYSWGGAAGCLADALVQCSQLEAVSLSVPLEVWSDLAHAFAGAAAPRLTKLSLTLQRCAASQVLTLTQELPWHRLQEVAVDSITALLPRLSALPGGLAALRGLKLSGDVRGLDALWAAPWLTQLTRLEVWRLPHNNGGWDGSLVDDLPSGGRALPAGSAAALQHLSLTGIYADGGGFTPADGARLAACSLPALHELAVDNLMPRALPPLMAAGWAAGLRDLRVEGQVPGWCGAAGAAALARPSALTRLIFRYHSNEGYAISAPLSLAAFRTLLSAPWAATLQDLQLHGQPLGGSSAELTRLELHYGAAAPLNAAALGALLSAPWAAAPQELTISGCARGCGSAGAAAVRTLAAARLPRLRTFKLQNTRLTLAGAAALLAAPWLPGLTALELRGNTGMAASLLGGLACLDLRGLLAFALSDHYRYHQVNHGQITGVTGDDVRALGRAPWLRRLQRLEVDVEAPYGDLQDTLKHYHACRGALLEGAPFEACVKRGVDAELYVRYPRCCLEAPNGFVAASKVWSAEHEACFFRAATNQDGLNNGQGTQSLEAQSRLWPLGEHMPGPAQEAVLAALPRTAWRCLRATCRAGRAAVDGRITSVALQRATCAPGLAAAARRLPALRHAGFGRALCAREADAAAAALATLTPALKSVALAMIADDEDEDEPWGGAEDEDEPPWGGAIQRLVAALGRCPRLEAVRLTVPKPAWGDLAAQLTAAAPALTNNLPFFFTPETLDLPWQQLQEVEMVCLAPLLPRVMGEVPGGLAALRGLKLSGDVRGLDALWAAPRLTQLTRLEVERWGGDDDGGGSLLVGLPSEGRPLPALQELGLTGFYAGGGGFTPADGAHLAACRLPALRRLALSCVAPGALPPLMAAGWAAGLRDLSVEAIEPGCAAELAALLFAPWAAATLRELSLVSQELGGSDAADAAAAALAAAHLLRLRACTLVDTRMSAASVAALAAAPWLPGLTALTLEENPGLSACLGDLAPLDMQGLRSFSLRNILPRAGVSGEQLLRLSGAPWLWQLEAVSVQVCAAPWAPQDVEEHRRGCSTALLEAGSFKACVARGAADGLYVAKPMFFLDDDDVIIIDDDDDDDDDDGGDGDGDAEGEEKESGEVEAEGDGGLLDM